MDLYSLKSSSIWQKIIILIAQLILIVWSYYVSFPEGINTMLSIFPVKGISLLVIIIFNVLSFIRILFTFFIFLKRKISVEEVFSIPIAFALYYVGFSFFAKYSNSQSVITIIIGIIFFLTGCFFNSFSEMQRYFWKKDLKNKGLLFTKGLFGISRHPNYFGDILWVSGYAIVTANIFSLIVPILLFCFFYFYNIPLLEEYLENKYKDEFNNYRRKVKRLIPFLL